MTGSIAPIPDFSIRFMAGFGLYVENRQGLRVTDFTPLRQKAEQWRVELQGAYDRKHKRGPRPCMRCSREFDSEGIHNRMCDPCRRGGDSLASNPITFPRRASRAA